MRRVFVNYSFIILFSVRKENTKCCKTNKKNAFYGYKVRGESTVQMQLCENILLEDRQCPGIDDGQIERLIKNNTTRDVSETPHILHGDFLSVS